LIRVKISPATRRVFFKEDMLERNHYFLLQDYVKEERRNQFEDYIKIANEIGIAIYPTDQEINRIVEKIEEKIKNPPRESIEAKFKKNKLNDLITPAAFYSTMIKPMLATGKDAYKPKEEEIEAFCRNLQESTVNIVLYYAFSKTCSPGRTQSPDWKVDFAELEMLRNWGLISKVGEIMGFDVRFILVDENTAIPIEPDFLGNTDEDLEFNQNLFKEYTKEFNGSIIYRSLIDSVSQPLGNKFKDLYQLNFERAREEIINALQEDNPTPEIIRIGVFLDIIPQRVLEKYNLSLSDVNEINENIRYRNLSDLRNLPNDLIDHLVDLTSHIRSIMNLRSVAAEIVQQDPNSINDYPEYNPERLYGGVTRSKGRWSFLPSPVRYNGMTVNPMHGLAVYSKEERKFLGICPWRNLPEESEVVYLDNKKPLLVLK